jgi:hypothetical protein
MRATYIVLASVCALAVTGRALAGCPVADAKIEKAIATKPEFRDAANAQVVRDLRAAMRQWCSTHTKMRSRASGSSPC